MEPCNPFYPTPPRPLSAGVGRGTCHFDGFVDLGLGSFALNVMSGFCASPMQTRIRFFAGFSPLSSPGLCSHRQPSSLLCLVPFPYLPLQRLLPPCFLALPFPPAAFCLAAQLHRKLKRAIRNPILGQFYLCGVCIAGCRHTQRTRKRLRGGSRASGQIN